MSQDEYEILPTASWFDVQGRIIPNQPDLPSLLRKVQPTPLDLVQRIICRTQRNKRQEKQKEAWTAPLPPPHPPVLHAHEDFYPDYPEDWIDVTKEASNRLLTAHPRGQRISVTECSQYYQEGGVEILFEVSALIFTSLPTLSMASKF